MVGFILGWGWVPFSNVKLVNSKARLGSDHWVEFGLGKNLWGLTQGFGFFSGQFKNMALCVPLLPGLGVYSLFPTNLGWGPKVFLRIFWNKAKVGLGFVGIWV